MTEIKKGFVYFQTHGIIKLLAFPKFGDITLKIQDGEVVASEQRELKRYKKTD